MLEKPLPTSTSHAGVWKTLALSCALVAASAAWPLAARADGFNISVSWDDNLVVNGAGPRIEGSDHAVEQARSVAAFSKLRIEGPIDVAATASGSASAKVRADDNLQSMVVTEVAGDTLIVKLVKDANFRTKNGVQVSVGFSQLTSADLKGSGNLKIDLVQGPAFSLQLAGSGDVTVGAAQANSLNLALAGSGDLTVHGIASDKVEVALSGSGDIDVDGRASAVAIKAAGSGDVSASELKAQHAQASLAGSGDIAVHASESLAASIAGSGDIIYAGSPKKLDQRVVGSGEVIRQ